MVDRRRKRIELDVVVSCKAKRLDNGEELKVNLPTYRCESCKITYTIACMEELEHRIYWCPSCNYSLIRLEGISYDKC